MSGFERCIDIVLREEGGYVNHPSDPGGETNFGISKRAYPGTDIKALNREGAIEIYRRDYWLPIKGDDLPWPTNLVVFDAAVNQGVDTAKKLLQKALELPQDGLFGAATMKKALEAAPASLCARFMAERAIRYTGTRNFDTFGRGWMTRLFRVTLEV